MTWTPNPAIVTGFRVLLMNGQSRRFYPNDNRKEDASGKKRGFIITNCQPVYGWGAQNQTFKPDI